MKTCCIIKLFLFCAVFVLLSCEDTSPEQSSLITVTGETTRASTGSEEIPYDITRVIFTGKEIAWFNAQTREIQFNENFNPDDLTVYQNLHFYLGKEYLFTVYSYAMPIHSFIVNDLVLYMEMEDRCYLHDCYPLRLMENNPIVKENKEKRAAAWSKFIHQLKNENKLKE